MPGGKKNGSAARGLKRLGECIARGRSLVAEEMETTRRRVGLVELVMNCLRPELGPRVERESDYESLIEAFFWAEDEAVSQMSVVMEHWQDGVFAGEEVVDMPADNLDLERWFRRPRSHQRRILGRARTHAGLIREGPTLMPTLDAHQAHPEPFTAADLMPYHAARPPPIQRQVRRRHHIARRARSRLMRPGLLMELEQRYIKLF